MDFKMRVARILTKFLVLEGKIGIKSLLHGFPFLVAGPESMRGRELEGEFSFFWGWTHGYERGFLDVLDILREQKEE